MKDFVVFSHKIFTNKTLSILMDWNIFYFRKKKQILNRKKTAVIGWGHKPTADKARRYAAEHNLPYIALEDGFLRSLGLGCEGADPLSLVVDGSGIYYDATASVSTSPLP